MSRAAFDRWISGLKPTGIEVIDGLRRAQAGKLDDADVKPGEAIRFGGYGEDRALTNFILEKGYDSVYQNTAGVRTVVLICEPGAGPEVADRANLAVARLGALADLPGVARRVVSR